MSRGSPAIMTEDFRLFPPPPKGCEIAIAWNAVSTLGKAASFVS
jgi:hypothetical protein